MNSNPRSSEPTLQPLPASSLANSAAQTFVGSDESIGAKQFELTDVAGGCVVVTASAVLSCALLIVNGAIVMAMLSVIAAGGAQWVQNESASQFLLFGCPVAMLIIQWWMIDRLRWILRRRGT